MNAAHQSPPPADRRLLRRAASACTSLVVAAVLTGCAGPDPATDSGGPTGTAALVAQAPRAADDPRVLAISIDGLNPTALTRLGRRGTPHLHRLLRQGASTLNARSQVEKTVTLPNHTSMITGRRISSNHRGHGVTWNDDRAGSTVQAASGDDDIASVFTEVHDAGGSTALFSTKSKFSLFDRSWPAAVDRSTIKVEDDTALVAAARRDLLRRERAFTFLHLGLPDQTGHAQGWMSPAYLDAVRTVDGLLGTLLDAIDSRRSLAGLRIVLTADHGGVPGTHNHADAEALDDYRVPFLVWGPGVDRGDLYAMNPDTRRDPGESRPRFKGTQPIRNGEVANVALDLLGLRHVPGSKWDRQQDLAWLEQ